jgi:hypothetical protein
MRSGPRFAAVSVTLLRHAERAFYIVARATDRFEISNCGGSRDGHF